MRDKGNHIITTTIEHPAVLGTCEFLEKNGYRVTYLGVDENGWLEPAKLRHAIAADTILATIMMANNEVGTILPIKELSSICHEKGVLFHTDAVQAAGKIKVDIQELGADMLSLSGHKLHAPKGVGALYVRKGVELEPLIHGGKQESGIRAGTENVPAIVGLGKAAQIAQQELVEEAERVSRFRDKLIKSILENVEHVRLNGHPQVRLPNNVNVSIDFVEGEAIVLNLDLEGICASTGSACSSSSLEPSHVLLAMGLPPEQAHSSLRLTLGKWTTEEDIKRVLEVLPRIVTRLRAMSPLLKNKR